MEAYKSWENIMAKPKTENAHWYPRYAKDFLTSESVMCMTLEQKGMYSHLLDYAWVNNGIPTNKAHLQMLCLCDEQTFNRCWTSVEIMFKQNGNRYYNERQELERKKYSDKKEKCAKAGRASALARKKEGNGRSTDAEQTLNDIDTDKDIDTDINNTPPLNPPEGEKQKSVSCAKWSLEKALLIVPSEALNTTEFMSVWEKWLKHLQEKKKLPKGTSLQTQLDKLTEWGVTRAIEALNFSISNNYQGIFENNSLNKKSEKRPNPNERSYDGPVK